jgi:uncharacterized oxidoreductase
MRITAEKLKELAYSVLVSAGARAEDSKLVSDNLVESNLVGHDSHGVIRLPRYVKEIREGQINPRASLRIVKENPGSLVIDADWGFGQVAAAEAMTLAIDKASSAGVASAGIFNCNDVGRLGGYCTAAAERDCIGIMTVNDGAVYTKLVAPWGGISGALGTNPISAAVPMGLAPPLCADFATSVLAGGKIEVARKRGEELPVGCIIDALGRPSTNPEDFFASPPGALLPLGGAVAGHKGFALGLIVDILSGALSGSGCSGAGERYAQGVFILVIRIAAFTPLEEFIERASRLVENTKASPKADGISEILIPGEPEWSEKEKRLREGIIIEKATWADIVQTAGEVGVHGDWK